ncbi:MAG: maleylpyruvate isomerase N-terminal domain-containing protein [Chloroflexi bacterium]|nr:maleylpyruvate isomerase N-terminal domain-containing protein [Chloroflexota bacterium]
MSMNTLGVDIHEVSRSIEIVAGRLAVMVRGISDLDVPTKGLDWSIRETASHVAAAAELNTGILKGTLEPHAVADIAAINSEGLTRVDPGSPGELANGIFRAAEGLAAAARSHPAGQAVRWVDGVEQDAGTVLAAVLGEFLVHGFDIARSVRQNWDIRKQHAAQVLAGTAPAMPLFVHRENAAGFTGSYDIRVRGGVRFVARFDDGVLTIESPGPKGADCYLWADPVALLLVFYGRVNQWGQVARGKMLSWGRKPWLGLKFKGLIIDP